MDAFLAVMAMIGILTTATVLSFPVDWVLENTLVRAHNYLLAKHQEWSKALTR